LEEKGKNKGRDFDHRTLSIIVSLMDVTSCRVRDDMNAFAGNGERKRGKEAGRKIQSQRNETDTHTHTHTHTNTHIQQTTQHRHTKTILKKQMVDIEVLN
jgi:hypothetical protein